MDGWRKGWMKERVDGQVDAVIVLSEGLTPSGFFLPPNFNSPLSG